MFVPDDAAFAGAPAGTFDIKPENRAQLTGVLTNLILPGTVMVADIDKAIDNGKGKAVLATMGGGTLTATKDGGKTVLTDAAGHKATITQGDEQFTNGVVHHVDAVLMPAKPGERTGGRPEGRQVAATSWGDVQAVAPDAAFAHHSTSARQTARYSRVRARADDGA